jgi:hypothetical protein
MTRKGAILPDEDHVVRYVPWARLRKDEYDNVIGFLPQAFELRMNEDSLSVSWLEYFNGDREKQLHAVVKELRNDRNLGKKSAFGVGKIEEIKRTCKDNNARVRIVYEPGRNIKSHSSIRNLPRNDLKLLEALAGEVFSELIRNIDVPN